MKGKIIKLKNGGTLIFERSKLNNCSAFEIGFLAGAYAEKKPGTAHLLEHTLFKKTTNRTNAEVETDRNKIVFLNASTSMDYLVLKFLRTNKLLSKSLDFASDVLVNSIVDDEFFDTEKEVVTEELSMCLDNESRDIFVKNLKQTCGNAKTSSDIVGRTEENIRAIKFKDLVAFKKKYFVGNNFIVSAVSSLPLRKIKKEINDKFVSKIKYDETSKKPARYYDKNEINKPSSVKIFKNDQEKITVLISIKIDVNEFDIYKKNYNYVFLAKYFAGVQGDLFLKLRNKGLVYRLDSDISSFKTNSLFNIMFETSKEKVKEICEIISSEIKHVTTDGFEEEKIKSYQDNLEYIADEAMPTKISKKCHVNLLDYICYGEIFDLSKKQQKKLREGVTGENSKLVANKVFDKNNDIFVTVLGNITKSFVPSLEFFKSKFLLAGENR